MAVTSEAVHMILFAVHKGISNSVALVAACLWVWDGHFSQYVQLLIIDVM